MFGLLSNVTRGGGRLTAPNKGFTLAEVLVTLGIIGVVSAMTVPTLMQNYQRKSYVVQLHKVYNEFQQAALQLMTDKNALNLSEAGLNSDDAAGNFVKTYFKIVKDCGTDAAMCFPEKDNYKKISGDKVTFWYGKRHFVLASGASIATYYNARSGLIMEIWVDTNGAKGPNIIGRDMFVMFLYNNGVLDDLNSQNDADDNVTGYANVPLSKELREEKFNRYCMAGSGVNIHGCFGKLLNDNWEMTY